MPDENDEKQNDWLKTALKVIGLVLAILLAVVVIGFGLIVGFCALAFRK